MAKNFLIPAILLVMQDLALDFLLLVCFCSEQESLLLLNSEFTTETNDRELVDLEELPHHVQQSAGFPFGCCLWWCLLCSRLSQAMSLLATCVQPAVFLSGLFVCLGCLCQVLVVSTWNVVSVSHTFNHSFPSSVVHSHFLFLALKADAKVNWHCCGRHRYQLLIIDTSVKLVQ